MKNTLFKILFFIYLFSNQVYSQKSQGIGTDTPNPRAVIELNVENPSTFPQGLLMPRLNTPQRISLGTVAGLPAGMSVYDATLNSFFVWTGSAWTDLGGSSSQWTTSGANIFYTGGNVSVGTSTVTSSRLSIQSLGNSSTTSALNIVNSGGTSILYMRDDGMMGINNTAPGYHLHVNGRVKSNGLNETSDIRLKKDIEKLTSVLEKVLLLQGVSYRMRNGELRIENGTQNNTKNNSQFSILNSPLKKEIGLIAQEVEKLFPELVATDSEGFKSLEYSRIVALLIEAIKEQNQEIQDSKSKIQKLETSIGNDKSDIEKLKAEWIDYKKGLESLYPIKSGK